MNKFSLVLLAFFLPVATSYGDSPEQQFLQQVYAMAARRFIARKRFSPGIGSLLNISMMNADWLNTLAVAPAAFARATSSSPMQHGIATACSR